MKRHPLLICSLLLLSVLGSFVHAQSPTLTFTLETSTNNGQSVTPRLTWSTTPAATSCTATGATDWAGTKAAAGTLVLSAVTSSRTYGIVCNWPGVTKLALAWVAPTTNTDGSALTDLSGYRIQYGQSATDLSQSAYQQTLATTWTSPDLAPGTWFAAVRAFNTLGLESALSNVVSKNLTAGASDSRSLQLTIRFPSAPVAQ